MSLSNNVKSLNYFKGIFENSGEGIFISDTNGKILSSNPAFSKLLGYKKGELTGKLFTDITHKKSTVQNKIASGKIHYLQRSCKFPLEMDMLDKRGTAVPVMLRTVLMNDPNGKLAEVIGIVEDRRIDKGQTVLDQQIWETRETLHNVLANSGDAIIVVDGNGRITVVNDALLEMLGYQANEIVGRHLIEISPAEGTFTSTTGEEISITKEYYNYNAEKVNELFENGRVVNYELYLICMDRKIVPVEATISVLKDQQGESRGSIAICRDITERKKTEDELIKAQGFLENIFNASADGLLVSSRKGKIIMTNKALEEMLGYSEDELIGRSAHEFTPHGKKHQKQGKEFIATLLKVGSVTNFNRTWLRKDGSLLEVEESAAHLKDTDGTTTGAVASIRDITERKHFEEKLKKSEEKYYNLFDSAGESIISTNKEGMITNVNKKAEELYGYTREELVGQSILVIFPPKVRAQQAKGLSLLKKSGRLPKIGKPLETRNIRKDGHEFPVETFLSTLKVHGEYIFTAFTRDISERKHAETEIREAKEFLENIFKTTSDAIMVTDPQGMITMVNEAMENMMGYARNELLGKHSSVLTMNDKKHRDKVHKNLAKLFEEGAVYGYEGIWQGKDGEHIFTESNLSLLKDKEGTILGGVSFTRDITEKKKFEDVLLQAEKLKSLGELAGGVAHDFNNILAAILGRVQLLRIKIDTPPHKQERRKTTVSLRKGLEIVEKAALDGAETVRRIQEFSRRREDDKHFTEIDINNVIADSLEFTKVRWKDDAETRSIIINIKKDFSPLAPIAGSAPELREVFTNLINNAIDAMPQGGNIKIKTLMDNSHVVITLDDTGVGITRSIRDRIFDPFFTTKGPKSTGLGMSVSYGIISRHRGTIKAGSVKGRGATITVQLPKLEEAIEAKEKKSTLKNDNKGKILIIEDEEDVRHLLKDILAEDGHEVKTASNGNKGIELFKKKQFDLVFTDLGMPGISGWQVAQKIKKLNDMIPVTLITGWKIQFKESELKKRGVDFIVNKPFKVEQILNAVQEGLALKTNGKKSIKDAKKKKAPARRAGSKNRRQG
jgi:PAS domain S-box-containing protein